MVASTTMRLLPLLITLIIVPHLGLCASEIPLPIYSEPDPAIRGHLLDLQIFPPSSKACNWSSSKIEVDSKNFLSIGTIIETSIVSIRGAVLPTASDSFSVSLSCTTAEEELLRATANISVTSDVNVTFDVTTNPSPADVDESLTANITLRNSGGSSAIAANCSLLVVPDDNLDIKVSCPGDESATLNHPCTFRSLRAAETQVITMQFSKFPDRDVDVRVSCTADNVPEGFGHNFTIYRKTDAKVIIGPVAIPAKVAAGSTFSVGTTISNQGRATADKLHCVFGIGAPSVFVSANGTQTCVPTIDKQTNTTTELRCLIGDLPPNETKALSFFFHTDSGVEEGTKLKFNWNCTAEGLSNTNQSVESTTTRESKLTVTPPKSNTIAGGRDAALFKLDNPGPSDVVHGQCIFALPKGFKFDQYSQNKNFTCNKSTDATQLDCDIKRLLPEHSQDVDLSLLVPKEANATDSFAIAISCRTSTSAEFNNVTVPLVVGATPSQLLPPQPVAQDNTMILLVTVVMAIGLLIVIVIWWRRKQDRAGWDATGPTPRSPSLNRFSEMELASRSDD